ncbi:unnamed protein product [Boreogadus saida]
MKWRGGLRPHPGQHREGSAGGWRGSSWQLGLICLVIERPRRLNEAPHTFQQIAARRAELREMRRIRQGSAPGQWMTTSSPQQGQIGLAT